MGVHDPRVVRAVRIEGGRPVEAAGTRTAEIAIVPAASGGKEDAVAVAVASDQCSVHPILCGPSPGAIVP